MPDHTLILGIIGMSTVGLSLGFLGAGGSSITVPLLIYVLGVEPRQAIPMSLAIVGSTSSWGAYLNYRRDVTDWRAGLMFGLEGVVGAYFGAQLTWMVTPAALMLIFAALLVVIGMLMLFTAGRDLDKPQQRSLWKCSVAGGFVGLLTGFLGVGGGFLIVPALVWFGGLNMRYAIGTSLMVIAINSASGIVGHAARARIDFAFAALLVASAMCGMLVGTRISHGTSPRILRRVFAVFLLAIAAFLFVKNYGQVF